MLQQFPRTIQHKKFKIFHIHLNAGYFGAGIIGNG